MGFLIKGAKSRGKTSEPASGNIYDQYILDGMRDPLDPVDMTYFAKAPHLRSAGGPTLKGQHNLMERLKAGDRVPQIESDAILSATTEEALRRGISPRTAIPGEIGGYVDEQALRRAVLRDEANRAAAQQVMDQYAADSVKLPPPPSWTSPLSYWGDSENYDAARWKKDALQNKANKTAKRERGLRAKQDAITNDPIARRMAAEAKYQQNSPILRDAQRLYDIKQPLK